MKKDKDIYALRTIYDGTPEEVKKDAWFAWINKIKASCKDPKFHQA